MARPRGFLRFMSQTPLVPKSRRWRTIAIVAALAAGLAYPAYRMIESWSRDDALRMARAGKFVEAEPGLRAAIERDPADAEVAEALARGSLEAGRNEEAERYLELWVAARPDRTEAHRALFEFARKSKNWAKALPAGLRLRELEPNDPQLTRTLVSVAFEAGSMDVAEKLVRELIASQPGNPGFRVTLASILRGRGDGAGSVAILDEVIRDQPTFTPALADRAAAYEESGEPAKAIPLLREVLKSDKQRQRSAGYRLSIALERNGQHDEAKKVLDEVRRLQDVSTAEEAMKNQPGDPGLRVRLGAALLAAGHLDDGVRMVSSAFGLDPRFAPAHQALAEHYEKTGQPAKAAEHRRQLKAP